MPKGLAAEGPGALRADPFNSPGERVVGRDLGAAPADGGWGGLGEYILCASNGLCTILAVPRSGTFQVFKPACVSITGSLPSPHPWPR